MTNPDHCDAARDLAALGYPVFPCKPGSKAPLTRQGFKAATRDERQILHWWDRWPNANIGIACGTADLVVLDIDTKHNAISDALAALTTLKLDPKGLVLAWTGLAENGARGLHAYFRGAVRTGPLEWPGVELRSRGAYVVAPPSVHPSGERYAWMTTLLAARRLPELPDHLKPQRIASVPEPEMVLTEGNRHDGLKAITIDLVRSGVTAPDLLAGAILAANRHRCHPPLPANEVEALTTWAVTSALADRGRHGRALANEILSHFGRLERHA
jgi:hypothetical protein